MTTREQAPAEGGAGDGDDRAGLRPSHDASFHLVGRRGVLFDARRQRLYALNRGAGFMWCCLVEGYSRHDIAHAYAVRARIPVDQAKRSLTATLGRWQSLGLLTGSGSPAPSDREPSAADEPAAPATAAPTVARGGSTRISILDTTFDVVCEVPAIDRDVASVLGGFAAATVGPDAPCAVERVTIAAAGDGSVELRHAREIRWKGPSPQAACASFAMLVRVALERSRSYPAIHSGAVAGARGTVLFPGPSGCGKSTLMAALLAAGADVRCDDTVVLDRPTMRIRPVVPHLCLKSGSWPAVGRWFAGWPDSPVLLRSDGARVRYVTAAAQAARAGATTQGHSVHALVFPRYRRGASTRLIPIDAGAALHRLSRCIDPLGHAIAAGDIERLIRWVGTLKCYSLIHDSLDDSIAALREILT